MSKEDVRLHLVVQGRVQGVGFRYYVSENARDLGVTGWVRNTFKGEVEIMAEGPREQLESLLEQVQQGPSLATVTHIKSEWLDAQGKFSQFSIAHSL